MATARLRRSLPLMEHPYEGIVQILEMAAREQPTAEELQARFEQRKQTGRPTPFFRNGDDDILYFMGRLLGLVHFDGPRLCLTEAGQKLFSHLYSDDFGVELFRYLLAQSRYKFSYFAQVADGLRNQVQLYGRRVPLSTYKAILGGTNRRSSKEIRSLVTSCGVVREIDNEIEIDAVFLDQDADTLDLQRLVESVRSLIDQRGTIVYSELIVELAEVFPSQRLSELETKLRSALRINASRTTEYVDGVL